MEGARGMTVNRRMAGDKLAAACWKGYEAIGMKVKDGKKVPNCVPVQKEQG